MVQFCAVTDNNVVESVGKGEMHRWLVEGVKKYIIYGKKVAVGDHLSCSKNLGS